MKTKIKFQLLLGTILSSLLLLTSCQTYTTQNKLMRNNLYTGNINQSIKDLDKSDLKTESRNIALYNMEKGMLLYLNGDYETAVKSWVKADKKLEELYTKSITKTAATYTINDELNDYTGETHERILLPLFSSIAFMAEGNSQNATTMIRRTYDLVLFLNSQHKAPSPENDYFTHYFSAVIFEYTGQWDSALVELRKSIDDLYKLKANKKNINVAAETEILQTAGRIASYYHR